jgi:hypothetical protein
MSNAVASHPPSLHRWLRTTSLVAGVTCLTLCTAAVAILWSVESGVSALAQGIAGKAVPATELIRATNEVALKVGTFTRTRAEADHKPATDEFAHALRTFGQTRVDLAALDEGQETAALIRLAVPQIIIWREAFEQTAKFFSQSERSTRGIASQASLLTTLCTQLTTDDGTLIAGQRAPQHRKTFEQSLGAIGDIQNSVLFASSTLNPAELARAFSSQQKLNESVSAVLAATAPSDLRDFIDEVFSKIKDMGEELSSLKESIVTRNAAQEQTVAAGNATLALIDPVVRKIMQSTLTTADQSNRRLHLTVGSLAAAALIIPLAGFFAGRLLTTRINRRLGPITQRLGHAAGETTASTGQAETDATALAATAEEQSSAIDLLSSNAQAVADAIRSNLNHMNDATGLTASASQRAASGGTNIAGLNTAMGDIATSSHRIQQTVSAIDEIAFQTNLLALNAAIEAARAGEAGRGFAIVAEEVRRLAQRCSVAARETADVIAQSQATTTRGVQAAGQVQKDFASITQDITQIRTLVEQTASSSNQQTSDVEAMTAALKQLRAGTSNLAEQSSRGAQFASGLHAHALQLEADTVELNSFLSVPGHQTIGAATATLTTEIEKSSSLPSTPLSPSSAERRSSPGNRHRSVPLLTKAH